MPVTRRPWTLLALSGVAGAFALRATASWWAGALPGCAVLEWTGLHCPGCGGTRCATRLFQGDLAGALAMNAAVVLVATAGIAVVAAAVWREWQGRPARGVPPWLAWSLAGFLLVFSVARNLPWWPFTLLAPP
jgi:hypothetical protein